MFDKSANRSSYRSVFARRWSGFLASFLTLVMVGALTAPAPASGAADDPAPYKRMDTGQPTELYAALFQYRNSYITVGNGTKLWDHSAEAYELGQQGDQFVRDVRTFDRASPSPGVDDFLGFVPKDRMYVGGYEMDQINLYRSDILGTVPNAKPGDFGTLTRSAKDAVVAEANQFCTTFSPQYADEWGNVIFPKTSGARDDWCASFSDYEPISPVEGQSPQIGFVFKEPVEGLGLVPLFWHLKWQVVSREGSYRYSHRTPSIDVIIGRKGDFPTVGQPTFPYLPYPYRYAVSSVDVGNFTTVHTFEYAPDDAAHLLGYVFPAVPGFVQSPTLVDTSGGVESPDRASLILNQDYTNTSSQTQSLSFDAQYKDVTTLSVSSTQSTSHLRGFEYGVKVGVEAGVDLKGFSAKVSTEISASTKAEDVFELSSTRSSSELSSVTKTYTVPLNVPPHTHVRLQAAIYDDVIGTQTYRGTIAPYWRHVDDDRAWNITEAQLQPWDVEFDVQASQSSRIEVTVDETSTLPGLIRSATTIDQIRAASDYTSTDAGTLRLYRAFLNREPDVGGAVYWIGQTQKGFNPDDLAWSFGKSVEFKAKYGVLSNEEFLDLVYHNMLGRDPEPGGFAYWLALMERDVQPLHQHEIVRWVVANPEFIGRYPYAPIG